MSALPQAQRWNRFFQRHVTSSLVLEDDYFLRKWGHCEEHLDALAAAGGPASFTAVELGTGWFPVVPLGLVLNGAERVWSVDIHPMLERAAVVETMRRYVQLADRVRVARPSTLDRMAELAEAPGTRDAAGLLAELGIDVRATDARTLDLPVSSVDLFVSNNTLEHIAPDVILGILEEFRRVARPSGVMSHFIDLADHYAHFDRRITPFNFLRYDEDRWRLFNNRLHYQNRLRASDYRRLHEQAGWRIVDEHVRRGSRKRLRSLTLAGSFRGYDEDDLLVHKASMTSVLA